MLQKCSFSFLDPYSVGLHSYVWHPVLSLGNYTDAQEVGFVLKLNEVSHKEEKIQDNVLDNKIMSLCQNCPYLLAQ